MESGRGWKLGDFNLQKFMTPDKFITGILFGVLLLVIAWPTEKNEDDDNVDDEANQSSSGNYDADGYLDSDYIHTLEEKLKETLSYVSGVGEIEVMITLSTSGEEVLNKDVPYSRSTKVETEGEKEVSESLYESNEETVLVEHDGDESAYVVKTIYPQIEGVLVVAEGGLDAAIKTEIIEAIEALFGVETHKVKVLGMD